MSDEEMKKILLELREKRKSNPKSLTSVRPTGSASIVNMDFASLYPSTMTIKFPTKQSIRKKKIKKIFE